MKTIGKILVVIFLLMSCQENRDPQPVSKKLEKASFTTLDKEENLRNAFEKVGLFQSGNSAGRLMYSLADFDSDSILKVIQSDSIHYTYTLKIKNSRTIKSFENLVFTRQPNGFIASVIEYTSNEPVTSLDNFSGRIRKYDLEGTLLNEVSIGNVDLRNPGGRTKACFADIEFVCVSGGEHSTATNIPTPCLRWEPIVTIDCFGGSGGLGPGANGGWYNLGTYIPDPVGGSGSGGGGSTGSGSTGGGSPSGGNPNNDPSFQGGGGIGVLPVYLTKAEFEAFIEALTDPEEKRRMQLAYLKVHGASEFVIMIEDLLTTADITVGDVWEINLTVNQVYLNQKAEFFIAIFNPTTVGTILSLGLNSVTLSTPTRTRYFGLVARYANRNPGQGYSSFTAFKRAHGEAGVGMDWHHIVEQRATNLTRFGAEKIHNTNNLVRIERTIHQTQINAFYSSNRQFTNGISVREWLNTKSFEFQYEFGMDILHRIKNDLLLPI